MAVYKHAKSRFYHYDFQYKGQRFHGSTGVTGLRKAKEIEQKLRVEAALGTLNDKSQMTLDLAALQWWQERGVTMRSAPDRERQLAVLIRLIGPNTLLTAIDTSRVSEAIEKRRKMPFQRANSDGARKYWPSNGTVNRDIIDALRPILQRAKRVWGVKGLKEINWSELRLSEPKPKAREFTSSELNSLLNTLPEHWRDMVRFACRYGCRLGELFFELSAADIDDRSNARLTLANRKSGIDHVIPLLPSDAANLAARMGRAKAAGLNTVWYRQLKNGKLVALTYGGASKAISNAMTVTGLRKSKGMKGAHDLRRHSAIQTLRSTGNLRLVQKLLGHASIQSTLSYAHTMEGDLKAGLEQVSRNSPEAHPERTVKILRIQRSRRR